MTPELTPDDPKLVVSNLLRNHWTDPAVTTEYEDEHPDFSWDIDAHFDADRWVHTGWFDQSSDNPQVTVVFDSSNPGTTTGFDATAPNGEKSAFTENRMNVDVWVHNDRDLTGDMNPKKYAWQLYLRTHLVLLDHSPMGDHPWQWLGTGTVESPEEPDETPIGGRWRIPVTYGDIKRT